ncbi:hypothetical protein B1757_13770 [Acidithiobacillus marinus]|uniref:Uncharacterized protein n=2 Tax=Acidithiobacillus marinus TaxID=187490 RepID=A0A2I1DIG6_9PROT|nr:hypothetical protein B1757_13770 [Acidithiobacillus marinus]
MLFSRKHPAHSGQRCLRSCRDIKNRDINEGKLNNQKPVIRLASRPATQKIQELFEMNTEDFIAEANTSAVIMESLTEDEGEYLYAVIWGKVEKRYWFPYILVIDKEHRTLITVVALVKDDEIGGACVFVAKNDLKRGIPKPAPRQYILAAAQKRGIGIPLWIDLVYYPETAARSEGRGGSAARVDVTVSVRYKSQDMLFSGGKDIPAMRFDRISACIQRAIDRAKKKETPEDPITHMTGRVTVKSTGEVIMEEVLMGDAKV